MMFSNSGLTDEITLSGWVAEVEEFKSSRVEKSLLPLKRKKKKEKSLTPKRGELQGRVRKCAGEAGFGEDVEAAAGA
jgi:hypothetical protein